MKNKIVGEIHKLSSGKFDLHVIVNFELSSYEIADYNTTKADDEFIREAACYARSLLINYKHGL